MILKTGKYTCPISDLIVNITKICYTDPRGEYAKVKLSLINKNNGIVYETNRNYKLTLRNVQHWDTIK